MGTQNILNYYGNKLDAKLSYSEYYDFYLAADEDNFNREVVYSDHIIGYEEPRTIQTGNVSNVLPLWIDLNNTGCTLQPAFTGVSVVQQDSYFTFNSAGTSASYISNPPHYSTGYPQSIISQNYWGGAYAYCDCPYEDCDPISTGNSGDTCGGKTGFTANSSFQSYSIENNWLNTVDIGVAPYMYNPVWDNIRLHKDNMAISGSGTDYLSNEIFSILHLDKRFKMWQVSANTQSPSQSGATTRNVSLDFFTRPDSGDATTPGPEDSSKFNMNGTRRYTISSATDSSGYYQELNGGYYAGVYKYHGYPYSVLPDRPDEGWAMETFLKLRATGTTTGGTCFSTNYNLESNVRVNPGDGCYDTDAAGNITNYLTHPRWNTGITVTNSGVTIGDAYDCTDFLRRGECRKVEEEDRGRGNFGEYNCLNDEYIDITCSRCVEEQSNQGFCLCCRELGFNTPENVPSSEVYNFSYVTDSEGDCVDTACYGMEYTNYDYNTDTWLTARTQNLNCTADTRTVNDDFPNNSGFFYYVGTRAENKFHNELLTETGCTSMSGYNCCMDTISGHTLGPAVLNVSPYDIATGGTSTTVTMTSTTEDIYSNNLGFRITPDFRIGYRTIRYTGSCETTGGTTNCDTGNTFMFGYAIEEEYSDVICPSIINSGTCEDTWLHVGVVFERYFPLISGSSCAQSLGNGVEYALGGLLDPLYLFSGITSSIGQNRCDNVFDELPLIPEDGYYKFDASGITGRTDDTCCFTAGTTFGSWLSHDEYRRGDLVFYINGRRHFTVENFEEIIPRTLNQHRDLQVGVPYNISWGGGSIGLLENMTLTGCDPVPTGNSGDTCGTLAQNRCEWTGLTGDTCDSRTGYTNSQTGYTASTSACTLNGFIQKLQPDQDDLGLLIQENFAGTWMGGISQFRYYAKPLQADSMYHNFLVNKDRYKLIDCEFTKNCSKNSCDSSQVLYLREGNMYDIKAIFGYLSDNLYFTTDNNQVKFRAYTQENVSTVKFYKKFKQEAAVEVTMPVWMNPDDTLEVVITKMDDSLDAIVTLLGNTYK